MVDLNLFALMINKVLTFENSNHGKSQQTNILHYKIEKRICKVMDVKTSSSNFGAICV